MSRTAIIEQAPPAPSRLAVPTLDGLRGVAVLLVVWAQLPILNALRPVRLLNTAVQPGYLGVDIFLVLSGFLITRILLHGRDRGRPLREFFVRRAARIAPIYYLTIAVLAVVASGPYLWWCAAYLSNLHFTFSQEAAPMRHTWSLCVEAHFYLFWPFVVYATPPRHRARVAAAVVAIGFLSALVITVTVAPFYAPKLIYRFTITRMASLGMGALFAICETRMTDCGWRRRWLTTLGLAAVALLAAGLAIHVKLARGGGYSTWTSLRIATQMAGFTVVSGAAFVLAYGANGKRGVLPAALTRGLLPHLGMVSYGIYLYHYPIFLWLGVIAGEASAGSAGAVRTAGEAALPSLAALAATLTLAEVSYRFCELPILRRAGSSRGRRAAPEAAAPAG